MQTDHSEKTEVQLMTTMELVLTDGGVDGGCIPEIISIWPPYILPDPL